MDRLKIATVWLGGCSGCHMSFLDLDEFLIEFSSHVELVYSPLIDIKEYPRLVDLCLVEGAVCNRDNLEILHTIRAQTKWVIAFGDCAVTGNVPAIRNQLGTGNTEHVLQRAYADGAEAIGLASVQDGIVPALLDRVTPLHEQVYVDAFLPGCPPPAARIRAVLDQILRGEPVRLEGLELRFG